MIQRWKALDLKITDFEYHHHRLGEIIQLKRWGSREQNNNVSERLTEMKPVRNEVTSERGYCRIISVARWWCELKANEPESYWYYPHYPILFLSWKKFFELGFCEGRVLPLGCQFDQSWRKNDLASWQGSFEERSPLVSRFSEMPFLDVPGTATEQVRACGFRRSSLSFDNAPKIRDSVLL